MIDIVFILLSCIAIFGALGMILLAQPIYSALSLIVCIVALAGIFGLLSAPFLFLVQIILYAGAIITLLLFIVMFLNVQKESLPEEPNKIKTIVLGAFLLIPINALVIKGFLTLPTQSLGAVNNDFGSIKVFGMELFTKWLVPFELISLLILAALVGAVIYARKDKNHG